MVNPIQTNNGNGCIQKQIERGYPSVVKYHVGGFNPIRRTNTLAEALDKVGYDDTIELHKDIQENVTVNKPIVLKGNGHKIKVPAGEVGLLVKQPIIIEDIVFEVGSRANALILEHDSTLTNVHTQFIGPIASFYPLVWFKYGTHTVRRGTLAKSLSDEGTSVSMYDTSVYSYYGPDIETSERNECSLFEGHVTMSRGFVASATFYDVTLEDTHVGKFVQAHDAALRNITLTTYDDALLKLCPTAKRLKKEPAHGPLSSVTGNDYHMYLSGQVILQRYNIGRVSDDALGFYLSNASATIEYIYHEKRMMHHNAYKSSIAFKNCNEANYWTVDDSTLQQVKSKVATNSVQKTAMEQLDNLIGLTNVKKQLRTILNTLKVGGGQGFSHHMIFAGNAGTGKTTVAKLVAQALFEVGVIPENKCTFATNDTLVKGYVGQTGENVARILDGALGGVLFIDEAYQLTVRDGETTFNDEVISVLIRYMEDHRDELVVIAAGYSKEMREFLASNSGLSRRFQWIEFDDYTPQEMVDIFELIRQSHGDQYGADIDTRIILPLFQKLVSLNLSRPDASGRVTNGGNGGLVRNVYQRITLAKNDRYVEYGGDLTINKDDIVKGFEEEMRQTLHKT